MKSNTHKLSNKMNTSNNLIRKFKRVSPMPTNLLLFEEEFQIILFIIVTLEICVKC